MEKNEIINLKIESISSDGNGVGHHDGMAVFVPFSAPGDIADIKIVKVLNRYAFGIIDTLTQPSASRIENDCDAFPKCGGCAFRHIDYPTELAVKHDFVTSALKHIGNLDVEVHETLSAQCAERYRNKVQFPVFNNGGKLDIGFFAPRSHRVVSARDCRLQPKIVNKIAVDVCRILSELGVTAYDEAAQKGELRHIFVRTSNATGRIMLCLVVNAQGFRGEQRFVREIAELYPEIETVVVNINQKNTNVILGDSVRVIHGCGYLSDELCGVAARLSPFSFFQINHAAAEILYHKISELAGAGRDDTVLDMYCGAGTIGLSLAKSVKKVIGVEIVPDTVKDACYNAQTMQAHNCEFIAADALLAARQLIARKEKIDVAVVDPPRKGCSPETLDALVSLSPKRIVMVSCNPATFARDLAYLAGAGYTPGDVWPVDMFPRTKHVEAVCVLKSCNFKDK